MTESWFQCHLCEVLYPQRDSVIEHVVTFHRVKTDIAQGERGNNLWKERRLPNLKVSLKRIRTRTENKRRSDDNDDQIQDVKVGLNETRGCLGSIKDDDKLAPTSTRGGPARGTFKCKKCSANFVQDIYLQYHKLVHTHLWRKIFKCQKTKMEVLHVMYSVPKEEQAFTCPLCPDKAVFNDYKDFLLHARSKDHSKSGLGEDGVTCERVDGNDRRRDEMSSGSFRRNRTNENVLSPQPMPQEESEGKGISCNICEILFSNNCQLVEHVLNKHPDHIAGFQCFLCVNILGDRRQLTAHLDLIHHQQIKTTRLLNILSKCRYILKSEVSMDLDICDGHDTTMKYQCPYCQFKFRCSKSFTEHLDFHDRKGVGCQLCGRHDVDGMLLEVGSTEIWICESGCRYRCFICMESFPSFMDLRTHSQSHLKCFMVVEDKISNNYKGRMYFKPSLECGVCNSNFENLRLLKYHQLTHTFFWNHELREEQRSVIFKILYGGQSVDPARFKCPICSDLSPFRNYETFLKHALSSPHVPDLITLENEGTSLSETGMDITVPSEMLELSLFEDQGENVDPLGGNVDTEIAGFTPEMRVKLEYDIPDED